MPIVPYVGPISNGSELYSNVDQDKFYRRGGMQSGFNLIQGRERRLLQLQARHEARMEEERAIAWEKAELAKKKKT